MKTTSIVVHSVQNELANVLWYVISLTIWITT